MLPGALDLPSRKAGIVASVEAALARAGEGSVTVGGLVEAFGAGAFGLLLILLNLPSAVFAPPALVGIAAVPTAVFGVQMMLGRGQPWLPRNLLDRPVSVPALRRVLVLAAPWLDRLETFGRPRLQGAAGPLAFRLFGFFALCAAVIVLVPIPGTNVLPALSLVVLAVAFLCRDGLLVLLGTALALAGILVAVVAAGLAVGFARWLLSLA